MAFLRKGIGDSDSGIQSVGLPREIFCAVRWAAIPCVVVFVASWSAAALTDLHSAAYQVSTASFLPGQPQQPDMREAALRPAAKPILRPTAELKVARLDQPVLPRLAKPEKPVVTAADPFGDIVADAKISREKLLAAFADAGMEIAEAPTQQSVELASIAPIAARFDTVLAVPAAEPAAAQPTALSDLTLGHTGVTGELTYAAVEADAQDPVQLALATLGDDPLAMDAEPDASDTEESAPDNVELPPAKPEAKPGKPAAREVAKPGRESGREPAQAAEKPVAPARKPGRSERQETQALAYARPDNPAGGAFNKLFNSPRAGDRVAVYDISAAVVHMPDGSKLEAHSGIGKMADNPRYVHVKMNGPTPPNTYRLTMREKRFHGVEAVRMTPVGEQTMHGRDGILAHSYLLRGGRAESHGCVAFANYDRFLKAFKQGKVTHIIVVPSMSKLPKVRMASMGRGT